MAVNSVTLHLPEISYKRAQRAAMLLNRSIEELLESMLNSALPALEDTSTNLEAEMAQLPTLSDADLWRVARSQMRAEDVSLLHELLDAQAERQLSNEEAHQLENLYQQAGRLTVLKSQAYALLHQRGYAVPQP
ncbi:MAG: hypothetical protein ONB44_01225 [candidate division KSB1 bacterium]|nr:hypothetical protein [candidate division KSB1 bacterium]MDZ7300742.1 hypothetical protein [candidate division KSB1 bacterium]MDZ7309988.1 hypothetical protein [candidate division KSB1 bacterium]